MCVQKLGFFKPGHKYIVNSLQFGTIHYFIIVINNHKITFYFRKINRSSLDGSIHRHVQFDKFGKPSKQKCTFMASFTGNVWENNLAVKHFLMHTYYNIKQANSHYSSILM